MDVHGSGQKYEKLIPIDDDDSGSFSSGAESPVSAGSLPQSGIHIDINKLKQESSNRFRSKWYEIILRYSEVDDAVESDEIDLHTGKILVDNGHLRSLADEGQTIDGVRIHGSIWAGDYDYERVLKEESKSERLQRKLKQKMRELLKNEDRFFNNSSPLNTSDSEVLEDNLLLFNLSPNKRLSTSPIKRKAGLLPGGFLLPVKKSSLSNKSSPVKSNKTVVEEAHSESELEEYDELFLMISDLNHDVVVALYSCAFLKCPFSSESKASYKAHLLSRHRPELQRLGYPVSCSLKEESYSISELSILKLNLHFPLNKHIPPGNPYECKRELSSGTCQKMFLTKNQLADHHHKHPRECSKRRQVLVCPILGCDFMTDGGFFEWRTHVNSHGSVDRPNIPILNADRSKTEQMDNLEDVFSDSVSSLNFSEDEKEGTRETGRNTTTQDIDEFWNSTPLQPKPLTLHFDIQTSDEEE